MTDFVASQNAANLLYNMVEYKGETEALEYLYSLKPHVVQHAKFLSTPVRLTALGRQTLGLVTYLMQLSIIVMGIQLSSYTLKMARLTM